ncbi:Chlorophyll a-b binding protein CP26, chloroplastic [Cymbomonas tetramitiformis]|uniref:Chlorophyll a-b binding protein, chloroplastic n=1 Tax=Cymbomonas tetramitiformis TaxID=36881 RepID=A0AAE0GA49_9CHLO|nr:Chlorophyll a-b binding protein CP26, chloroplastic [Cymbomonas tetramitiformis]
MSLVSSFLGEALVAKETVISGPTMLFKKAAPKAAPKKGTKKAAPKGSSAGGKSVKGWGGGDAVYNLDKWYGPDRSLYLPGGLLDADDIPAYLNGDLAGDYGYDPLGLGTDEEQVEAYRKTELLHARWAMLGVAGCVIPEACEALGSGNQISGSVWWQTGAAMLDGGLLKYFGTEIPLPLVVVVAAEVGLMGAVETYRNKNEGPAGEDLDPLYPGGKYFDPLGLADDPDAFAELKVKEIKNGRLAMMAMLGFAVQAGVTGDGPFANWAGHVNDPFGYNLLTVVGSAERVPTL